MEYSLSDIALADEMGKNPALAKAVHRNARLLQELPTYPAIAALQYVQTSQYSVAAGNSTQNIQVPSNATRLLGVALCGLGDTAEAAAWAANITMGITISSNVIVQDMPAIQYYPARQSYPLGYFPISRKVSGNVQFTLNFANAGAGATTVQVVIFFLVEDNTLL
jgi:hypothetical protein